MGKPSTECRDECRDDCAICLSPLSGVVHRLACSHRFCGPCIIGNTQKGDATSMEVEGTCPTCRAPYAVTMNKVFGNYVNRAGRDGETMKEKERRLRRKNKNFKRQERRRRRAPERADARGPVELGSDAFDEDGYLVIG